MLGIVSRNYTRRRIIRWCRLKKKLRLQRHDFQINILSSRLELEFFDLPAMSWTALNVYGLAISPNLFKINFHSFVGILYIL